MFAQYQMMLRQLAPLTAHIGISVVAGGPCLWLKLPANKSSEALFNLLIKHKVSIAPGKMLLSSHQFDGYFRLTFALPWDKRMTQGIDLLVTQTLLFLES
jgi:DNA-binding transcriptional MocR family regulator